MTETEIERLTIALGGDNTEYIEMLDESARETQRYFREQIDSATRAFQDVDATVAEGLRIGMQQEYNNILNEGQGIVRQYRTEEDKYNDTVEELSRYLRVGAIDQGTFNRAQAEAQDELKRSRVDVRHYGEAVRSVGMMVTAAGAAITGLFGATAYTSFDLFSKSELEAQRLTSALDLGGRAAIGLMPIYKDLAREIDNLTTVNESETLAMLQQAASLGVFGDGAERAVKNAIGLSRSLGIGEHSAMKMAVMLEQGSTQMLTRLLPSLRLIKDETERVTKAQELLNNMYVAAQDEVNTTAGTVDKFQSEMRGLRKQIGEDVANVAKPFIQSSTEIVRGVKEWAEENRGLSGSLILLGTGAGTALTSIGGLIMGLGHAIATTTTDTTKIVELIRANTTLSNVLTGPLVRGFTLATTRIAGMAAVLGTTFAIMRQFSTAGLPQLQKELDQVAEAGQRSAAGFQKLITGLSTGEMLARSEDRISQLRRETEALVKEAERAEAEAERFRHGTPEKAKAAQDMGLSFFTDSSLALMESITGDAEREDQIAKASRDRIKEIAKEVDLLRERMQEAARAREEGFDSPEAKKSAEDYIKLLEKQVATVGKDELAVKRWEIAATTANGKVLKTIDDLITRVRQANAWEEWLKSQEKASKEFIDDVGDMIQKTDEFIRTNGLSQEQIELYRLRERAGADKDRQAMVQTLEGLLRQKQALQDRNRLMDEGRQLADQFASPEEKFAKKIADANRLLAAGALGPNGRKVFDRVVREAQKELDQAGLTAKVGFEFEAIRKGSAEHRKLMAWSEEFGKQARERAGAGVGAVKAVENIAMHGVGDPLIGKPMMTVLERIAKAAEEENRKKPLPLKVAGFVGR